MPGSSSEVDYYEVLGVQQGSSKEEIRKAYRRLALRFHPDKNQGDDQKSAEDMFKLISEAYDVLSDDNKRSVYDRYGHDGLRNGATNGSSGFDSNMHFRDASELFREVFGDDPFASFFGRPNRSHGAGERSRGYSDFHGGFGDDDFFRRPFGGMDAGFGAFGGFGSFGSAFGNHDPHGMLGGSMFDSMGGGSMSSSFSSGFSRFGGGAVSQSTETVIRDGKKVTRTKTTKNGVTSERVEETSLETGETLSLIVDGKQHVGQLEN